MKSTVTYRVRMVEADGLIRPLSGSHKTQQEAKRAAIKAATLAKSPKWAIYRTQTTLVEEGNVRHE